MAIQMPITWGWDRVRDAVHTVGSASPEEYWSGAGRAAGAPAIRRIGLADLRYALARGWDDFGANRSDVIFLCVLYPLVGLLLAWLAAGNRMVPLLFPLAAGFALVGPLAAVGLNEMSRRREQEGVTSWVDAFGVLRAPSIGVIALLGLVLIELFLLWLLAAQAVYDLTLGPEPPASVAAFVRDVFTTGAGWAMIVVGIGVGFLFALAALMISVVSFPLLLDRNVGLDVAVGTSVRAVLANPGTMAVWGLIVACGLVIGSLPFLLGLAVVLPVLGHATWHLYRRVVSA
ncbi:MAG: DUF2189 domain-containing protein [Alphaproteobacteria bacterium]|nr:DUF2189 domain-containing protein [Alphaproteobacteria bacterium]